MSNIFNDLNNLENTYITFTVEDPETKDKLYIPISNVDLLTKTSQEIVQIISAIIEENLKTKKL
jgi:hypothetical protein